MDLQLGTSSAEKGRKPNIALAWTEGPETNIEFSILEETFWTPVLG